MRIYITSPSGAEVDLDNNETYNHLPDDYDKLERIMFEKIGYAVCFMNFFHPDWYGERCPSFGQRLSVMSLMSDFCGNREKKYGDIKWIRERVFLFQDEIENMC